MNKLTQKGSITRKLVDYVRFLHMSFGNHLVAYIPSYWVRKVCYRHILGVQIGKHSHIQMGVRMYSPYKIRIGDNCSIGNNSLLDGRRGIKIGNNVDLAGYVKILTLGHDLDDPEYGTVGAAVSIEDHASIFTGASVLPGVIVGEGSAVGLNAVVTKSTEPWKIYVGNPAKFVRDRKISNLTYLHNYKRYFH